jgi:subtilisin family serine protease
MRKNILTLGLYALTFAFSLQLSAQAIPGTLNWYNKEGAGMATDKAYGLLKKKKSEPVIVAVIDSGVDIEHEDLQGKIWVNTKEIPNNKIDDDKNGYVDDIHGWNFLGNAKGENLDAARLEKTRILAKLMDKYEGIDPASIKSDEEFELYQSVKNEIEAERAQYEPYLEMIKSGALDAETKKYIEDQLNYNLNVNYDDRSLIGDNPDDFNAHAPLFFDGQIHSLHADISSE